MDLPTLGKPTRATSAMSLSSRRSHRSSPTSPCSAKAGARRRFERKRALPRPPRPPSAASQRSPGWRRSASTVPCWSRTHGALGHGHLEVASAPPVLALPLPVGAALAGAVRVVLERDQRRHVAVDDQPDPAARAAVAAVGPAEGHVRLPPEADRSRAAVASLDVEPTLIDELRHELRLRRPTAAPRTRCTRARHRRASGSGTPPGAAGRAPRWGWGPWSGWRHRWRSGAAR